MIERIRTILHDEGFVLVGFLNRKDACFPGWIDSWLSRGYNASMDWMGKNKRIREDPCSILDDGKTLISLAYPYYTQSPTGWEKNNPISRYAWGKDYHVVLRRKLRRALSTISSLIDGFQARSFVDTAPLPEKIIAVKAGLGWIGKNSMLINPDYGSFLFLAEIVCNVELTSFRTKHKDLCGDCRRCIDNCPTQSIKSDRQIDSRSCVSFLTIEKRGEFTHEESKSINYQLFGCDICQQVCPWNEKAIMIKDSPFACFDRWTQIDVESMATLTENAFEPLKRQSPIKRAGVEGIRRNAAAILKNRLAH